MVETALVLTAGLGTRLDPLTRIVAKAAVPLAGRPLVGRVLDWLREQGVREAVLNLHHRPESLTAIVGDGTPFGVRTRYSWEPTLLGSAGGPRHALPLIDADPLLIVNGDTLCPVPLEPFLAAHRRMGGAVTLALVPNPDSDHYNGVVLDADDRVVGFRPKGQAQGTWHFVGIQAAARSVFEGLPDNVPAETVAGLYRDLSAHHPDRIRGWRLALPFIDVGTPRDYLQAAVGLARDRQDALVEPGAVMGTDARLSGTVVWSGASIGDRADLEGCIVAGPVDVPAGLVARDAILLPASLVRPDDHARLEGHAGLLDLSPCQPPRFPRP